MSRRQWKRARRSLRVHARQLDAAKRLARKVPTWRRALVGLGFRGPARRWMERWERKHVEALKAALKKTAHVSMRAGPPPAPQNTDTLRERAGID